jgi:alpha-beta hydrolase superfamily lysophospholipase
MTTPPRWVTALVPGYGDHPGRYADLTEALANAGATVIGHAIDPATTDFESTVDRMNALLPKDDAPIVLIGLGLGGAVAVRHAQRYPGVATALVLAGPVLGGWPGVDLLAEDPLPGPAVDPDLLSRDPAVAAAFRADPLVWHAPYPRDTLEAIDEVLRTIDFDHPLGDELPALWLHGEEDEIAPAAETRTGMDRVRGLRFAERLYPGARHDLFHETNAAEVLADTLDFLVALIG